MKGLRLLAVKLFLTIEYPVSTYLVYKVDREYYTLGKYDLFWDKYKAIFNCDTKEGTFPNTFPGEKA